MKLHRPALLMAVFLVMGCPCWAEEPPVSAILACRGVVDNVSRLACFDRESAALAAAATHSSATSTPGASSVPQPGSAAASSSSSAASSMTSSAPPRAAVASPPDVATSSAAAAALDPRRTFGLQSGAIKDREVSAGIRPKDLPSVSAHIARISSAENGRLLFTLDNDQTWQQLLADGDLNARPGDEVTISRGMLGSYWLEASTGRGCKVKRVR